MKTTVEYGIKGKSLGKTGLFYIGGDKVALSASLTKRTFARLFDLVLGSLVGSIIFTVFFFTTISVPNAGNVVQPNIVDASTWQGIWKPFDEFMFNYYSGMFLASAITTFVGVLTFNVAIPMFTKRHQSLGKMMFKIAPVFGSESNVKVAILKRELPISILQSMITLSTIIVGADVAFVGLQYKQWHQAILASEPQIATISPIHEMYDVPKYGNIWNFMTVISTNANYMGNAVMYSYQQVFGFIKEILQIMYSSSLMIIFLSIMFGNNKRGFHDKFAHTSVVDMKTYQSVDTFESLVEKKETITHKSMKENIIPIQLNTNDKVK